jgi:hypothetical protein
MDSKDTNSNSEAIASLKNYITAYERKRATMQANQAYVPPNLDVLYGYMRLLGDKTWTAPNRVELQKVGTSVPDVSPQAPASQPLSPNKTRKTDRP